MANVFKRPGAKNYTARFQVNGKDRFRSTGESTKTAAEKKLKRLVEKEKGEHNLDQQVNELIRALEALPAKEQAEKRTEAARRILSGQQEKLAFTDAWATWMNSPKKRSPAPTTIKGYASYWRHFSEWMETKHKAVKYLHGVEPIIAEAYAEHLWGKGIATGTYNGNIKFLRSMFKVLKNRAGLMTNVWDDLPLMDLDRESRRNLTPEELQVVCSRATGNMKYMFLLGLFTGMRLGDAVCLEWSTIDFKKNLITYMPSKTKRKKRLVYVPMHALLAEQLKELKRSSKGKSLFPKERGEYEEAGAPSISKRIQDHFKACGIKTTEMPKDSRRVKSVTRVGFHSFRHSFVSLCAANDVPQVALMEMVGHGSPAMTNLYSHANQDQKAAAVAGLPVIDLSPTGGADE